MVGYRGEWYLSGFCHHRKAIRTFGVSRIVKATVLEDTFTMPPNATAQTLFGDHFGIVWDDQACNVRIKFNAAVAPYIRERQWHPAQHIRERRDGGLVLEFTTNHICGVRDWVLSLGADATVLAPAALVAEVKAELKRAVANYRR